MQMVNNAAERHIRSEYDITPDAVVDLREILSANSGDKTRHRHVVVVLDDGSSLWLDIGLENRDHSFTDIRWFNPAGAMKGVGAFTMVNGARQSFGCAAVKDQGEGGTFKWTIHKEDPLSDTEGTPVTGHKWNGGYAVTLLVDKNGEEAAARKPSDGNG